jgi:hypothetical protein
MKNPFKDYYRHTEICKDEFDKGLRLGVAIMILFVITPLAYFILSDFGVSEWKMGLILSALWLSTIIWLSVRNDDSEIKIAEIKKQLTKQNKS